MKRPMHAVKRSGPACRLFSIITGVGAILLTSCTSPAYMGVPLTVGSSNAEVQQLVRLARSGDRAAKLSLADRFERGDGIPRNATQAKLLYSEVAIGTGGQWLDPTSRRPNPLRVGGNRDDLARSAERRLQAMAGAGENRIRRTIVKGTIERADVDDDEAIATANVACGAILGDFASLIDPRPQPVCVASAFRMRGDARVYAVVHYNDAISDDRAARDRWGDYHHGASLELWPMPNTGECGTFDVIELTRGDEVVSKILVSWRNSSDRHC